MERYGLVYMLIGAAVVLIGSLDALGLGAPQWVYVENGLVENSTALTFLVVTIVVPWKVRQVYLRRGESEVQYLAFIGLAGILGLVGFLDEISFGKYVVGYKSPSIMDVNVTSVHSLVVVVHRWIRISTGSSRMETMVLLVGVFAVISAVIATFCKEQLQLILLNVWKRSYWHSLAACIIFLIPAVIIDAGVSRAFNDDVENVMESRGPSVWEELLELSAAVALLYGVVASRPQGSPGVEAQGFVERDRT